MDWARRLSYSSRWPMRSRQRACDTATIFPEVPRDLVLSRGSWEILFFEFLTPSSFFEVPSGPSPWFLRSGAGRGGGRSDCAWPSLDFRCPFSGRSRSAKGIPVHI